uniref:AAA domain-containing protein n=1 Tax=Syphacia muris TaxID=451379 RepID=A0A158R5J1_9BILA
LFRREAACYKFIKSIEKIKNIVILKLSFPLKKICKEVCRKKFLKKSVSGRWSSINFRSLFEEYLPWVDKYKPTTIKQIVGQNGEKSPLNKLLKWLKEWPKYHLGEGAKQKRPKPPPWLAQADGTSFKAALLSGPPGVGKTTCASLACKELGLQCVEMNASDARNKKMLDTHVAELLRSQQILRYFGKSANSNYSDELTHVLIMDEVDGMSGNEDRAGLSQLMQMIKGTKVPIICICNDRQSSKMRNLVNYCFDLRFPRPRVEQIRPMIQTIAFQEKLKVSKEEVDEIIEASNHDVRQTIYNLQLLSRGMDKHIEKKDVAMVNLFEAARLLLNAGTTIVEKQRMFFVDYSMMPLFIQENYLLVVSSKLQYERLNAIRNSAEAISNGDLIDKVIRNGGSWSLLNEQGLFSSVVPSLYMGGYLRSMISFPSWLGKNSSAVKHQRLLRQLESHAFHSFCYREVIGVLDEYDLTRDDLDEIVELGTWPGLVDFKKNIQTKVKSFFTRTYNKHSHLLPYALEDVSRKREYNLDEEGNLVEVENEDELNENDKSDSEFGFFMQFVVVLSLRSGEADFLYLCFPVELIHF